jgi:hypothetical protein
MPPRAKPTATRCVLAAGTLLAAPACAQPHASPAAGAPSLVVLLVVDQLSPELLGRYDALYSGGFRRLLDEGFRFERASHEHASTVTAVGHFTLATGVYPTRHGIVGNTWSVRTSDGWRNVYSVEDRRAPILGQPGIDGRSPVNAYRDGLATWILDHDPRARAVSVSAKDRAAIGLAGRARGERVEVYWLAEEAGVFVTSSYYRSGYPAWISDFNRRVMPRVYADTVWESVIPPAARSLSRPDTSQFELDGTHSAFPHRPSDVGASGDAAELNVWRWEYTPFPDRAVLELAMEAVRVLELGRRGSVDFLGVSLSQTDQIGHEFGPGSREQLDNLLRLDAELGRFLTFLDESLGARGWILALSADHGVLEIPEILVEQGENGRRLTRAERQEVLARVQRAVGTQGALAGDPELGERARRALVDLPYVATAYSFAEVENGAPVDSFAVLYARSHSRERVVGLPSRYGVYVRYQPGTLDFGAARATHGSPYYYDRHVPLVFLGAGIPTGSSTERAATVDVAPTLARLAQIPAPDDLDGKVLEAIVRP